MTDRADRIAIIAAAAFALAAVVLGLRTGYRTVDVDELVFRHTIVAMRNGEGYYPAMRDALVAKEGAPPSQVRSVRPPTLYLVLARFPASTWRYLVDAVYLATLLMAWRLARPLHPLGGPVAVFLTGMWILGATPFLFLHTELWAVPFLLAGALAMRNERWAAAAVALAMAALLRELYVLPLLIGLLVAPRRRAFVGAIVVVAGLALIHAGLARDIVAAGGKEPPLGPSGQGVRYLFNALSPSDRPLGWLVGVLGTVLGFLGLWRRRPIDPAARMLLPFVAVILPLTLLVGREYWGLVFGPALVCYLPAALPGLLPQWSPDRTLEPSHAK